MSNIYPEMMTMAQRKDLAANVRNLRQARGLRQSELAELANITRQTVSNLERGTVPQGETLGRILAVLGVETAAPEFDAQTSSWLTTIGSLIEAVPPLDRSTAVHEAMRVLATRVRGNVTPIRNTRAISEAEALELGAVAKRDVIEIEDDR